MAKLNPFKEALQKLQAKTPITTALGSSEMSDLTAALRDRAIWSARVENTHHVQVLKDSVESLINPRTVIRDGQPVTEGMNIATARAEIKQMLQRLGYNPGDKAGGIQDLSSDRRIELQLRQNVESAQGFGNFIQSQAPGALDAFPAQELFRAESRKDPRNWETRWMQAGGQIFEGRMIALKNDPIWEQISAFGTPYPPFDYGSGMWVRDIDRAEAESLGLIQPGEQAQSSVEDFNARLHASVKDIAPELQASLQQSFGDQIVIEDGIARWRNAA